MLKYESVLESIAKKIEDGTYPAYSQLPSMNQLCEDYQVSKITIKKSLDELEARGFISKRAGSGSFVKPSSTRDGGKIFDTSNQMQGFTAEHEAKGEKVETVVYDFSVVQPPEEVARELDMQQGDFAYHVCRMRKANDIPHVIEYSYMPISLITDLKLSSVQTSIYQHIEHDLGLKIGSAHRVIKAVLPTQEECERLQIEPNTPLLEVRQVAFLDDGVPFEYSISHHAQNYEFHSVSTR